MNEKNQCKCGNLMQYNYHYQAYTCSCGKVYNALGQELAPLSQWKDEWDNEPDDY